MSILTATIFMHILFVALLCLVQIYSRGALHSGGHIPNSLYCSQDMSKQTLKKNLFFVHSIKLLSLANTNSNSAEIKWASKSKSQYQFAANLISISRVISDFTCWTSVTPYRLNWLEEQIKSQYVARLSFREVPLSIRNKLSRRQWRCRAKLTLTQLIFV